MFSGLSSFASSFTGGLSLAESVFQPMIQDVLDMYVIQLPSGEEVSVSSNDASVKRKVQLKLDWNGAVLDDLEINVDTINRQIKMCAPNFPVVVSSGKITRLKISPCLSGVNVEVDGLSVQFGADMSSIFALATGSGAAAPPQRERPQNSPQDTLSGFEVPSPPPCSPPGFHLSQVPIQRRDTSYTTDESLEPAAFVQRVYESDTPRLPNRSPSRRSFGLGGKEVALGTFKRYSVEKGQLQRAGEIDGLPRSLSRRSSQSSDEAAVVKDGRLAPRLVGSTVACWNRDLHQTASPQKTSSAAESNDLDLSLPSNPVGNESRKQDPVTQQEGVEGGNILRSDKPSLSPFPPPITSSSLKEGSREWDMLRAVEDSFKGNEVLSSPREDTLEKPRPEPRDDFSSQEFQSSLTSKPTNPDTTIPTLPPVNRKDYETDESCSSESIIDERVETSRDTYKPSKSSRPIPAPPSYSKSGTIELPRGSAKSPGQRASLSTSRGHSSGKHRPPTEACRTSRSAVVLGAKSLQHPPDVSFQKFSDGSALSTSPDLDGSWLNKLVSAVGEQLDQLPMTGRSDVP